MPSSSDVENPATLPYSYAPLLDNEQSAADDDIIICRPRKTKMFFLVSSVLVVALFVVALIAGNGSTFLSDLNLANDVASTDEMAKKITPLSRGVEEGVSEKSFHPLLLGEDADNSYPWSSNMLDWQRTAFHFHPMKNWMNDPNAPVFYKGWYHLFFQHHPEAPVWGKIVWGHAVSKDMINWHHLPIAMDTDQWYDQQGVWTGSATILPDGQLIVLYTGSTNESLQVQNLAYPADPSDPLLINWLKYPGNPVLVPPPGIDTKDFRDPTTAWTTPQGKWRITIGSKINNNKTGISLVYDTQDFKTFELLDGLLHAVPGTGMWECVDFYPVSKHSKNGLDTSVDGPEVKHVVKASMDDDRNDYYAIGSYDAVTAKWTPDNPSLDVGIGLRYDYGIYYASKTFYDQNKQRRILWSWIKETDSETSDIRKGWASLMGIPRTIVLDKKTQSNIIQWPIEEINRLRRNLSVFRDVVVEAGSVVPLNIPAASQLDIVAEFEVDKETVQRLNKADVGYDCERNGAAKRGALGPFGFSVLADEGLIEHTPVYFYVAKGMNGNLKTFFCADQSRSSSAVDVDKSIYGGMVPVLKGEKLSMRILVDHSIVESFAQQGRTCITSRVYPTKAAIDNHAQLLLFNNATSAKVTASVNVWQMNSAHISSLAS